MWWNFRSSRIDHGGVCEGHPLASGLKSLSSKPYQSDSSELPNAVRTGQKSGETGFKSQRSNYSAQIQVWYNKGAF